MGDTINKITEYKNGTFCWSELMASNVDIAKQFYGDLFGWSFRDDPIGPESFYTMLFKDDSEVGAMYNLREEQVDQGVPTHWMPYISVDSVDETVAKAKELGAEIYIEGMDVFNAGRMAMLMEPDGATFALWQPNEHIGIKISGVHGSPGWFELASKDGVRSSNFYSKLFNWQIEIQEVGEGLKYTVFKQEDEKKAGVIQMDERWGDLPAHWMIYYTVDNIEDSLVKVTDMGGAVMVPKTEIPSVGTFSVIQDPQGAIVSLMQWA